MASKSNHKIIETWRNTGSGSRYYVTANDRVLKSTGKDGGKTKVLLQKETSAGLGQSIFLFKAGGFAGGGWIGLQVHSKVYLVSIPIERYPRSQQR